MAEENNSLLNISKEKRKEKIFDLQNQINILELNFNTLLKKYEINLESLLKKQEKLEERIQCPFNKNHFVTKKNYEKHYRRCELISKGINTKLSLPKPPSSQFFYKNSNIISLLKQNINIDDDKCKLIKTYEGNNNFPSYEIKKYEDDKHIICNIKDEVNLSNELGDKTVEERLKECVNDISLSSKIENEFIKKTENFSNIDQIMKIIEEKNAQIEKNEKSKTKLISEQRDYKRRRKSYRAKNIRISKRSPTQIQKDIIDSFMKDYKLFLEIEKDLKSKKEKKKRKT